MNRKGEINLGVLIISFIGIIVAIAIFSGTFEPIGKMTNIYTQTNLTVTTAATGNASVTLPGRENTTALILVNGTDVWTSNFTVSSTNTAGGLAIVLTTTDAAVLRGQNGTSVNVSYSYKPDGYNDGSGARGIIVLVLIFGALAIALFAFPQMREIMNMK